MRRPKVVCETPLYKVMLVHDSNLPLPSKAIKTPDDAAKIVSDYLRGVDREHFVGLYLNSANDLITLNTISVGTLNSSLVHPREVFKIALMVNASAVIVAHNHPSGNVEPSSEDLAITKQLLEAGKILGVPLHDHVAEGRHDHRRDHRHVDPHDVPEPHHGLHVVVGLALVRVRHLAAHPPPLAARGHVLRPARVGRQRCVRLDDPDIEFLYNNSQKGTEVYIF